MTITRYFCFLLAYLENAKIQLFCEFLPAKTIFVFSINSFSSFHYRCGARQWRLTERRLGAGGGDTIGY